ncbi:hypothetical protein ACM15_20485 [Parabacteroides goldsteinii]|uniref:Uncharacterized protein n=1 Tax=Parabacteroides goldsteinii TaxID=328812 RepID=A0A0J6CF96_9BACT|nr:hypothetical protein ACM15_20485 [Parabacteroides goldsteinii]
MLQSYKIIFKQANKLHAKFIINLFLIKFLNHPPFQMMQRQILNQSRYTHLSASLPVYNLIESGPYMATHKHRFTVINLGNL